MSRSAIDVKFFFSSECPPSKGGFPSLRGVGGKRIERSWSRSLFPHASRTGYANKKQNPPLPPPCPFQESPPPGPGPGGVGWGGKGAGNFRLRSNKEFLTLKLTLLTCSYSTVHTQQKKKKFVTPYRRLA